MRTRAFAIAGALLAATLTVASASASDHGRHEKEETHAREGREGGGVPETPDPTYSKECGACHLAYPPRFLSAGSWRAMLAGLDRHFGTDASLEPEVWADIERFVLPRSGPERRAAGPSLRITESPWFRREHDEVPADAATRPAVRSLANCGACHPGAERWDFDEDRVRIPRG